MKTKELKTLIEAAESLGHSDIDLMLDESRDGTEAYAEARAYLVKTGTQQDPHVILAFGYG